MRLLLPALLAALLGGCTFVYAERVGGNLSVEDKSATADNAGTAMVSDRRDPTINAAIPWWTP